MRKRYLGIAIIALCAIIAVVIYASTEKERYSKEFANNLFDYALPPQTKMLERHYFYGYSFGHLLGSGGEMPVVANMNLSTCLSKEEILNYYRDASLLPYPNSEKRGVEIEVYFPGEKRLHKEKDGFYFTGEDNSLRWVSSYKDKGIYSLTTSKKTQKYTLQISSSFNYIFKLDR